NHDFYCIEDVAKDAQASDVCDPNGVSIRVVSCKSSQPEDDLGDGHFSPDCVLTGSGRGVCIRSERQGIDPAGRTYTVGVAASDGCSNTTTREARVFVPHDQ